MEVNITQQEVSIPINISQGILLSPDFSETIERISSNFVIITDDTVKELYGETLYSHLSELGLKGNLLSFQSGEPSKNFKVAEHIIEQMFELNYTRDCVVIALGGGVVTDLAGFIASIYMRGISLVVAPTTLLGMVDAALGGKTGINTKFGKNLLGTIYQPKAVFIDLAIVENLPKELILEGSAEIIKYGLISTPQIFEHMRNFYNNWTEKDLGFFHKLITLSCQSKKSVVENDEHEKGFRRILNFGHTVGHALEKLSGFNLSHGLAVAIGMLVESSVSYIKSNLSEDELSEIFSLIKQYGFSTAFLKKVQVEELYSCMSLDKKASSSFPRVVLLDRIGQCATFGGEYCSQIELDSLKTAIDYVINHYEQ